MSAKYLHHHPEFIDVIRIYADQTGINPVLVEKDYWIMHCLYGLQQQGFSFFLKGGTSLSKGYQMIDRFSEDIDILISPPAEKGVFWGKNQNKPQHVESRKSYYDWLSKEINIEGLTSISRDTFFDDERYRSGGIRLYYPSMLTCSKDIKEGVLLECGFDAVTPYELITISSWIYEHAKGLAQIKDNRAISVPCYHPGYTFVEKLQTISTKFRKHQKRGHFAENFIRHYYDIYCLLNSQRVQDFIGTKEYLQHKKARLRSEDNPDITQNEAFLFTDSSVLALYEEQYTKSQGLYYKGKPTFGEIVTEIRKWAPKL